MTLYNILRKNLLSMKINRNVCEYIITYIQYPLVGDRLIKNIESCYWLYVVSTSTLTASLLVDVLCSVYTKSNHFHGCLELNTGHGISTTQRCTKVYKGVYKGVQRCTQHLGWLTSTSKDDRRTRPGWLQIYPFRVSMNVYFLLS